MVLDDSIHYIADTTGWFGVIDMNAQMRLSFHVLTMARARQCHFLCASDHKENDNPPPETAGSFTYSCGWHRGILHFVLNHQCLMVETSKAEAISWSTLTYDDEESSKGGQRIYYLFQELH